MPAAGLETQNRQQVVEKYYGKYPGVVIDNKARDNSGHRGEILVEVPGILEDRDNQQLPLQGWAKPCFVPGFFFVPEIDDHVWVEFSAGDINFPIWSGVWYPKEKAPQTVDGNAPTEAQKIIKSKLIIQIDDDNGSIYLGDNNGNSILLESGGITITANKNVIVKGTSVKLGDENAAQHILLGDMFNTSVWTMFSQHSHTTAIGPTSPPVPPPTQLPLSQAVTTK